MKLMNVFCGSMAVALCVAAGSLHAAMATRYVSANGNNSGGGSWQTAFKEIQAAIDASSDGDTITVTNGVYAPIVVSNKTVTIRSVNGAGVTVIDGGNTNRCATFVDQNGNAVRDAQLHGFTLCNGTAPVDDEGIGWQSMMSGEPSEYSYGGGTYGGTLYDCVITGNRAKYGAGAFNAELNRCRITGNVSSWDGGGTLTCTVNSSLVWNNTAVYGAGTYDSELNNCTVAGNRGSREGSGMHGGLARNSIVWGNTPKNFSNGSFRYSCTEPLRDGDGNIASDPQFANAAGGDFRLAFSSLCLNAGSTGLVALDSDVDGNALIQGGDVNMGAVVGTVGLALSPNVMDTESSGTQNLSFEVATVNPAMTWTAAAISSWLTVDPLTANGTGAGTVRFSVTGASSERTGIITVTGGGDSVAFAFTQTYITWYVDDDAGPGGDGASWATAFPTIQQAIDAAWDGEEIWVADGIYAPISVGSKIVTIRSANGADVTIIDGGGTNRCATFSQQDSDLPPAELHGFTLRNGAAPAENDGGWQFMSDEEEEPSRRGGGTYYGTLYDCILTGNNATHGGGACDAVLNRCRIIGNTATQDGGGAMSCTVNSSVVWQNSARSGGGVYRGIANNCTVVGNTATEDGGGIRQMEAYNSIIWGNTPDNHHDSHFGYSCTEPSDSGEDNVSFDPLFAHAAGGDFRLTFNSLCINAGSTNYVTLDSDLYGNPLIRDDCVSMGAIAGTAGLSLFPYAMGAADGTQDLSFVVNTIDNGMNWTATTTNSWITIAPATANGTGHGSVVFSVTGVSRERLGIITISSGNDSVAFTFTQNLTWYVDETVSGGDGTDWPTAFATIQQAADVAWSGDTILVADGIYTPFSVIHKTLTIQSVNGAEATIIDGGGANRCVRLDPHDFDWNDFDWQNSNSSSTELRGFTLRNGAAPEESGGGAYGGTLYDCIITGNSAEYGAGAASAVLNRCRIIGNISSWDGGGTFDCVVNSSFVWKNSAVYGGGVYGGVANNCTILGNSATLDGSGMLYADIRNSIVWDNSPQNHNGGDFAYSCTTPLVDGDGNIASDPLFANAAGGDFRLMFGSPCVGAGSTDFVMLDTDLHGNPLIQNGSVTMGAFAETLGLSLLENVTVVESAGAQNLSFAIATFNPGMNWTASSPDSWITVVTTTGTGDGTVTFSVAATASGRRAGTITISSGNDSVVLMVAQMDTVYVDETVSSGDGASWATAFATIQQAVDAAWDGEQILVAAGTYAPFTVADKILTIHGVDGADVTIVDGGGINRCATLDSRDFNGDDFNGGGFKWSDFDLPSTQLHGFTLRNGADRDYGGGVCGGTLYDCIITGNEAYAGGGAAYAKLNRCRIIGNTSPWDGGGTYYCIVNSSLVWGNTAVYGAGVYKSDANNCTIVGNTAGDRSDSAGIFDSDVRNSIVWDNTPKNFKGESSDVFEYNCTTPLISGTGNITTDDPCFVNAAAGDFRLTIFSPCIGMGSTNLVVLDTDLFGLPLIDTDGNVNMGALAEVPPLQIALSPESAQVDAASTPLSFTVETAFAWTAASSDSWITGLSQTGAQTGTVSFTVADNPSMNPRTGTVTVSIAGQVATFTVIQAGYIRTTVFVDEAQTTNPQLGTSWENAFTNLQDAVDIAEPGDRVLVADGIYASIYTVNKAITIQSVNGASTTIIDGNNAGRCARLGITEIDTDTILTGFTLRNGRDNVGSGSYGGTLNRCIITNNHSYVLLGHDGWGGGAHGGILNSCLIVGNSAVQQGGGAWRSTLNNCTVYGNTALTGGGVYGGTMINTIIWGNTDYNCDGGSFFYSCTTPEPGGTGNISDDPLFVNAAAGDFRLQTNSPCINTGSTHNLTVLTADLFGRPLIGSNGKVNMGAIASVSQTSQGVPYDWLEAYGLVEPGSFAAAYEDAAESDPAKKGYPVWHDYVAGTDPTNALSRLTAHIDVTDDIRYVWWTPDLRGETPARVYTVFGKTNLTDAAWLAPTNSAHHFFKVRVTIP